ncbi:MAG: hypothetical protein V4676_01650 [Bacteroidota bacterium]
MAKAKKAVTDVSADIINSLAEMQRASQKLDLSKFQTRDGALARGIQICPIYLKVRPYLELVKNFPLLPKKIRDAVALLMSASTVFARENKKTCQLIIINGKDSPDLVCPFPVNQLPPISNDQKK